MNDMKHIKSKCFYGGGKEEIYVLRRHTKGIHGCWYL